MATLSPVPQPSTLHRAAIRVYQRVRLPYDSYLFLLTGETGARSSAFPLSFRVYAVLPAEKPSSCSHFLGLMDAAAAQWQRAGLRGTAGNSAPARRRCQTGGPAAAGRFLQGWGVQ